MVFELVGVMYTFAFLSVFVFSLLSVCVLGVLRVRIILHNLCNLRKRRNFGQIRNLRNVRDYALFWCLCVLEFALALLCV